jgi:hypothetical protein
VIFSEAYEVEAGRQRSFQQSPVDVVRDVVVRWDENAGLRRDAVGSQLSTRLKRKRYKETGNEED